MNCKNLKDSYGNVVAVSDYLSDLNKRWSSDIAHPPGVWMAASGTFCPDPTRNFPFFTDMGCTDQQPENDGVVCSQSARVLWPMSNGPAIRWPDQFHQYAHIDNGWSSLLFCGNYQGVFYTLFNPPKEGELMLRIVETINGLP